LSLGILPRFTTLNVIYRNKLKNIMMFVICHPSDNTDSSCNTCYSHFVCGKNISTCNDRLHVARSGTFYALLLQYSVSRYFHNIKLVSLTRYILYTYVRYLHAYLLIYGAELFLRSCQLCSHLRNSQHFMEPESSLPCSQEPSTCPYPEPD
jgi:hypothetical protein